MSQKEKNWLRKVPYNYIPATWEVEIGGLRFKASPSKKLMRTDLKEKARYGGTHLRVWFK
jgi:hypothetical protein